MHLKTVVHPENQSERAEVLELAAVNNVLHIELYSNTQLQLQLYFFFKDFSPKDNHLESKLYYCILID